MSNVEVRRWMLGKTDKSIDEVVNFSQLRWLGHILRMPSHHLPQRAMLGGSQIRLEKGSRWSDQEMATVHEVSNCWSDACVMFFPWLEPPR
ncbi:unnamed protein product [Heterobilharzia americana]|nr:unnamed protein product [Heterobilharzia americana]